MTQLPNYEVLWNALPHPTIATDGDKNIIAFNAAAEQFFAVSARSMRGRPIADFAPVGSRLATLIDQAQRDGISLSERDIDVHWAESEARLSLVQINAINDIEDNQALLIVMQHGSIAEKMTRSLAHRGAARSVTGMAAALSHEIKNPLAAISGAAQLLQMSVPDGEIELCELIQEESSRIQRLVERMEHFTDSRPLEMDAVNLHDALQMTRRAAQVGFGDGVTFVENYDPSLPPTSGDRDQLAQAFQNLLKNAAEAVGEGGIITLKTAYRPGVRLAGLHGDERQSLPLEVTITDNGPGIPADLAPYIFEPFVTSKASGAGLGLALVSKIIADHGGIIECDTDAGRTTFRMLLPVHNTTSKEAVG